MSDNFPSIGEPVLDPSEKFAENGVDKYDLPLADGGLIDEVTHPALYSKYATSTYEEEGTLTASDAASDDRFGIAVSVYGDRLAVGAHKKDSTVTDAGKVYIYDWNGSSYTEIGQLTASDSQTGDVFGVSASVYEDRLIVGAHSEDSAGADAGKVYYYDWNGSAYVEVGQLTASDAQATDQYGMSVSVHADRLAVGAWNEDSEAFNAGKVYYYDGIATANRPNMTSPDPLCPYRIVADLT